MTKVAMRMFCLAAALSLGAGALAQSKPEPKAKPGEKTPAPQKAPEMSAGEKAAMEAMMKAGRPGPEHAFLATLAGEWKTVVTNWSAPGKEPTVSEGHNVATMVLGGRYLEERFESTFMETPFRGIGFTAFDNVTHKFVGTWIDEMSTGIFVSEGTLDASGKVLTTVGSYNDPVTGKPQLLRAVMTVVGPDEHRVEMRGKGPDGKEFKMMEMVYRRVKK